MSGSLLRRVLYRECLALLCSLLFVFLGGFKVNYHMMQGGVDAPCFHDFNHIVVE